MSEAAGTNGRLVRADHVKQYFPIKDGIVFDREVARVHAVDDVTFDIGQGETFGLVGESGCGKSTLARTLLRLLEPTEGEVHFEGRDISHLGRRELRPLRRDMQMIFQDPYASLNPRKRVGQIVGDPIRLHKRKDGKSVKTRVQELLERCGLSPEHYNRFPHEFSGGQRQRIGIARALALEPKLIIADEPVSALDVSIQAQIVNLLQDLQRDFGLTYLFVAHDLGVVRHVSNRVAVMYLGKIVEVAPADQLYRKPIHPYTVALLSAIPIPDPRRNRERERIVLKGDVPSPINPPPACRFHTRCPRATEICTQIEPPLVHYGNGHIAACHHPVAVTSEDLEGAEIAAESPRSAGDQVPPVSEANRGWAEGAPIEDRPNVHAPSEEPPRPGQPDTTVQAPGDTGLAPAGPEGQPIAPPPDPYERP